MNTCDVLRSYSDYIITCAVCAWLVSPFVLAVIDYINEGRTAK